MAKVIPFKAVRPLPSLTQRVVTRSYQAYTFKERQQIQGNNPDSFLHVLNPEFESSVRLRGIKRYSRVREKYLDFIAQGKLQKDDTSSYYLYRNTEDGVSASGILGAMSVHEYLSGKLKRHEDTLLHREQQFASFLGSTKFNAEPVLVAYKDHPELLKILDCILASNPEVTYLDDRQILHELWPINTPSQIQAIQNYFSEIQETYLMDGHHRTASSVLHAHTLDAASIPFSDSAHYFLACLLPESQIRVASFARMVTDLGAYAPDSFLLALHSNFDITEKGSEPWEPEKKHEFSLFLQGRFYKLVPKFKIDPLESPARTLDARILFDSLLAPLLGIADPRNDHRLHYLWHKYPALGIQKAVTSGKYAAGFGVYPVAFNQIKEIAVSGLTMPPKSTYITPKLLSGLTIYEF